MKTKLLGIAFSGLSVFSLSSQTITFTQPSGSPITTNSNSLRGFSSADFNMDGKKDFVIGNSYNNTLSIYLGSGNGQFTMAPGSPMASATGPIFTTITDFNGDLIPDIATANYNAGSISILLGTGTGSFSPAPGSPISIGNLGYCIDSKDFNMDGKMDIVAVSLSANQAYVYLGGGNGTFTAAPGSPIATGSGPYHVSAGLFNADTYPDFAVANGNGNTVSIFLGTGTGSFTVAPGSPIAVGSQPRSISVRDLNNDSHEDLVVANISSNNLSVLLGQGNGSFMNASGSPIACTAPYQTAIANFDSDGRLDIAVTNSNANSITILSGAGNGTFANATGYPMTLGSDPQPILTDDFNGDNKPDLLVGDYTANNVTVLLNSTPVGIIEYDKASEIKVYPNPATDHFNITVDNFESGMDITIYNALGQEVKKSSLINKSTDVSRNNLPKGLYTYRISNKDTVLKSGKIIFE